MRVLLPGATGFIGSEIARALIAAGHEVVGFGRDPALAARLLPGIGWISGDLRSMASAADWRPKLVGIDAVVNASGTLQSGLRDDVTAVQSRAIRALVDACAEAGIGHFVQISASDAAIDAASPFMASKAEADAHLAVSGLSHTILRPGLVIGRNAFGGTELLRVAASLPATGVVIAGTGGVRCVGMADVVAAVMQALAEPAGAQGRFDLVEAEARPLGDVIALHRRWLGFAPPHWRPRVPLWLLRPVSLMADGLGWLGWRSPLRANALGALVHGVGGDPDQARALLGRDALSLPEVLAALPPAGKADRWQARCALVFPLALASLLLLFVGSGLLGLMRAAQAAQVLEAGGMARQPAVWLVLAGAVADLGLAALLIWRRSARAALQGMLALSLAYVAGSLVLAPSLWLDPLGPLLKVLPVMALIGLCLAMVDER